MRYVECMAALQATHKRPRGILLTESSCCDTVHTRSLNIMRQMLTTLLVLLLCGRHSFRVFNYDDGRLQIHDLAPKLSMARLVEHIGV